MCHYVCVCVCVYVCMYVWKEKIAHKERESTLFLGDAEIYMDCMRDSMYVGF